MECESGGGVAPCHHVKVKHVKAYLFPKIGYVVSPQIIHFNRVFQIIHCNYILYRWWFQRFFIFTPIWGNDPI